MYKAIRPGTFGKTVCADTRRVEFDWKNDTVLSMGVRPDAVFIGDSLTELWELTAFFHKSGLFGEPRDWRGRDAIHRPAL